MEYATSSLPERGSSSRSRSAANGEAVWRKLSSFSFLSRLHTLHKVCEFSTLVSPPRLYGMMWSIWRRMPLPFAPQHRHWWPSRFLTWAFSDSDNSRCLLGFEGGATGCLLP